MIQINDKKDCCGCTACFNACPVNAIEMKPDEEGFLYPKINESKCINCGLCDRVCPVKNPVEKGKQTKGYIIRNKDLDIVKDSTSGGAFTAFANELLSKDAIVYGAGYDDEMNVVCKAATNRNDLAQMRGSKFVQSDLKTCFSQIKTQLEAGKIVLFTGTPCQIAGLYGFLKKRPEKLYCIDFVCRGVPSPGLWRNYLEMMQKKYKSKIINAKFKNKTYGYHATTMKIEFANKKIWKGSGRVDPMMKAFVKEMASRPSCSQCAFKGIERPSDLTMFDCYEYSSITGKPDDNKGYSSLFVHTQKGQELLDRIKDCLEIYEIDIDKLVTKNGIMVKSSAVPNKDRDRFYQLTATKPIDQAMDEINPITKKDYLIEFVKGLFYHLGLIQFVKKIKKKEVINTNTK